MSDLAKRSSPVIIVAQQRLNDNHTLLTLDAVERGGREVADRHGVAPGLTTRSARSNAAQLRRLGAT
jgi:hypothetical protein